MLTVAATKCQPLHITHCLSEPGYFWAKGSMSDDDEWKPWDSRRRRGLAWAKQMDGPRSCQLILLPGSLPASPRTDLHHPSVWSPGWPRGCSGQVRKQVAMCLPTHKMRRGQFSWPIFWKDRVQLGTEKEKEKKRVPVVNSVPGCALVFLGS